MSYAVKLLTNGMIDNYPKDVWMDHIKVKHWRDLLLAGKVGPKAVEEVLTSVLDEVIDWNKTEFIKSSNELTIQDRYKLFFWQRINSKGSNYSIVFKCKKCNEQNVNDFDLLDAKEKVIKKKVQKKEITLNNGRILSLKIPKRKDILDNIDHAIEFRKGVFEKISPLMFIDEIKDIEKHIELIEKSSETSIMEELRKKTSLRIMKKNKDAVIDENMIAETDAQIEKRIQDIKKLNDDKKQELTDKLNELNNKVKENLPAVKKILKENNFLEMESILDEYYEKLKTYENLVFDDYSEYLFSLSLCVDNLPDDYMNFILNEIDDRFIKDIEDFIQETQHGFDNMLTFKCKHCLAESKEKFDLNPDFFLI